MIRIEPGTAADLPEVLQLLQASGLPPEGLADHIGTLLIARQDETVVASAALELYRDGALLRSVAVAPVLRGRGVGRQMTHAAINLARERGLSVLYLLTLTAEAFFPKFGFERIGRDEVPASVNESIEFRSACPSSAIVMRKVLK